MARAPNDWQLGCTEVKQRGGYLLQTGQWSDCTFLVGTEPNHVVVPGHKLILAMASPVFEAMFFGNMPERNEPIRILDVQPEAFKALLEYIYTDNINISSFDKACELCYGAKKYMLPHLVKECTRYLWSDLYPKNACRAYEFARLFEENILMEKCLQIISTNTKDVLNDNSFEDVELNTVITVFSQNHLNIDSELDLFEAAERYAKVQDKRTSERSVSPPRDRRKSPEPSTSKEKVVNVESSSESSPEAVIESDQTIADCEKDDCSHKIDDKSSSCSGLGKSDSCDDGGKVENHHDNREAHCDQHKTEPQSDHEEISERDTRNTDKAEKGKPEGREIPSIRSAIQKIRFLTLTPQQFAKGPATSPLLTESESFAILMNILSSTSDVPMPKGFSTCRVPRKQLIGGYNTNRPTNSNSNAKPAFSVDVPSPELVEFVYNGLVDLWRAPPPNGASSSQQLPRMGLAPSLPKQPRHDGMYVPMSLGAGASHSHEPGERGFELNKIYCQRPIIQHTDCLNTSVLDCSVTFMVDKNICLLGVQVPTQAPSEESGTCAPPPPAYSELLYAHLLDADGARLTYTHYTNRVAYRQLQDIIFNRPVYIQRNKVYKVGIVFNKMGWYPMGTCAQQVVAESVFFNFGIGQSSDSVRDGLIRAIIFTY